MRTRFIHLTAHCLTLAGLLLAAPRVGHADLTDLFQPGLPDWVSSMASDAGPSDCWGPVDCTPAMLGDTFVGLLDINTDNDGILSAGRIPFPGGSNRLVIARNNSALVRDRFYVAYEHTTGALSASSQSVMSNNASLDRTILGLEKVFLDGQASLEIRLPFAAQRDFTFNRFSIQGDGEFGNVGLIGKLQLAKTENNVVSAGLAVQLPTGGDINGEFDSRAFTIVNDAVIISPFLAFAATPDSNWFYQGFAQADFTAKGNTFSGLGQSTEFDSQSLLRLSGGGGRWFFRKNQGLLRGLAGLAELHFTTTLEDSDSTTLVSMASAQTLSNVERHQSVLNLTSGLHLELPGKANARVGVNVPLRDDQRFHDATLMVQVNIPL
ncbi:MAG: hypothetical protein ACKVII_02060 [Planctomycetales bacterium]|jgi:hypothetical protein